MMIASDIELMKRLHGRYAGGQAVYSNFSSLISGSQYRLFYELCRKYIGRGSRVLDWGSGNGHASLFLRGQGHEVMGFSPVLPGAADPVRIPFEDGSFDAVVSVGVLEHVRESGGDEAESLREIRRILRRGGVFICYHFPSRYSWIEFVTRLVPSGRHYHRFRYTAGDVERLCAKAEMELVDRGQYGMLPRTSVGKIMSKGVRSSVRAAELFNVVDETLQRVFGVFSQNIFFIARPR